VRRVAEIARAFKMRVTGYARSRRGDEPVEELHLEGELDKALSGADYAVISLASKQAYKGADNLPETLANEQARNPRKHRQGTNSGEGR
jgi:phosphoglycerate dehydrogenase-like enzyme